MTYEELEKIINEYDKKDASKKDLGKVFEQMVEAEIKLVSTFDQNQLALYAIFSNLECDYKELKKEIYTNKIINTKI